MDNRELAILLTEAAEILNEGLFNRRTSYGENARRLADKYGDGTENKSTKLKLLLKIKLID